MKTPAQAMQVKEEFVPSRYPAGMGLQACYVKILSSRGLFALAMAFLDVADLETDNIVAVPGWYARTDK